jgi:hypothetical protein
MEPEGSSPLSQELATCPYPEPDWSSPCPQSNLQTRYQVRSVETRSLSLLLRQPAKSTKGIFWRGGGINRDAKSYFTPQKNRR